MTGSDPVGDGYRAEADSADVERRLRAAERSPAADGPDPNGAGTRRNQTARAADPIRTDRQTDPIRTDR